MIPSIIQQTILHNGYDLYLDDENLDFDLAIEDFVTGETIYYKKNKEWSELHEH